MKTRSDSILLSMFLLVTALFALAACSAAPEPAAATANPRPPAAEAPPVTTNSRIPDPTGAAPISDQRDPRIPELPFPDNPDPSQCGIPIQWGMDDPAWLTGMYQGQLIQPTVLLYDSHLRLGISGEAPHGSEVAIILYQQNPVMDYYLVRLKDSSKPVEGWIPAAFLSFEPVRPLQS